MIDFDKFYMLEALKLAKNAFDEDEVPVGAVIVCENQIIGKGYNQVEKLNDPTAHAEILAIRDACKNLNSFQLSGCEIYSSCEPCPMCMGAIYWARPDRLYFSASRYDAAQAGFDDEFIYSELDLALDERRIRFDCINHPEKMLPFKKWNDKSDKIVY